MRRRLPALAAALAACAIAGPGLAQPVIETDSGHIRLGPEDALTPAQTEALEESERQRLDRARRTGESALPTMTGETRAPPPPPPAPPPALVPAPSATAPAAVAVPAARTPPRPSYETLDEPADAYGDAIDALLDAWTRPPKVVRVAYPEPPRPDAPAAAETPPAPAGAGVPRVAPGTALHARALHEIRSDVGGPVVVELLEPPLAGAVATGRFEAAGDRMTLRLTALSWRGATVPIDAWAVDPATSGFAVPADVDRHLFARLVLPAALRFVEGFLARASEPERTVGTDGAVSHTTAEATERQAWYAGGAAATRSLGDILLQDAPSRPTLRIPRDTELAVLFLAPPGAPGTRPRAAPAAAAEAAR